MTRGETGLVLWFVLTIFGAIIGRFRRKRAEYRAFVAANRERAVTGEGEPWEVVGSEPGPKGKGRVWIEQRRK
jgi:hypothetical protein